VSQPGDKSKSGGDNYERPNQRYRCGRGAGWGKPCAAGPTPDGKCGDTSCPGGENALPPCIPRLTLRARRGRMTWQLCALVLLLIAGGFHFGGGAKSKPLAVDPGPLSAKHANFTAEQGCAACHPAHEAGLSGWLKATFSHTDMNAQCSTCHKFDGFAHQPHNEIFDTNPRARETDCRQCHTEHQGANAKLTTITDAQCHTCHKVQFERFDQGHPPFAANFPHAVRGGIKFNHAKHLLEYFKQPENASRAQQTCTECHAASPRERNIRTAGFETACGRCHEEQIPQNELVLLRLPEKPADAAKLAPDDATTFMAWYFQRAGTTNYGIALQQFMDAAAKEGVVSLASELKAQTGTNASAALVAGLSPELLARPAQLWMKGDKLEPPSLKVQSGWYWLEDLYPELRYKPAGHADAVARAWLEFSLAAAARATNAGDAKRAADFRNEIAHLRTGVGRCVKCHAVTASASQPEPRVEWHYTGSQLREHTKFSHSAHLGLTSCTDCHALNPQADYEGQYKDFTTTTSVSNFKSIALANCTSCHAERKVRSDCLLCHQYHRQSLLVRTPE
jgi:predicted CXXCH cytochrome family protein